MDQINISRNCQLHPDNLLEFIQIKQMNSTSDKSLFYCTECIDGDNSFKGLDFILLKSIINQGDKKIIQKWPPINNQQILDDLARVTSNAQSHSSVEESIIQFFSTLKSEIAKKIDVCQKKMINMTKHMPFDGESILCKYQSISKITELRELLCKNQADLQSNETAFKQLIESVERDKERNSQQLQALLNQSQNQQSLISFEYPNQIKTSILSFIDQINFFDTNESNLEVVNNNQSSQQDSFSQGIMKLISNKSNFCSDRFLNEVNIQLKKLNPLLHQLSFANQFKNNKQPIAFSDLHNEQLDMIDTYVSHLNKFKRDQEYLEKVMNSSEVQQLKEILNKKFNFISTNSLKELEGYLIQTYPFLNPLCELLQSPGIVDIFPNIELIKGEFSGGKDRLVISKQNNQFEISNLLSQSSNNCVLNLKLEMDKKYVFRFQDQRLDQSNKYFGIGLMQQSNINQSHGHDDMLTCWFRQPSYQNKIIFNNGSGIGKEVKGEFQVKCNTEEEIELRVCLNEYILQVLDYPNYKSQIEINDEYQQNLVNKKDLTLYIDPFNSNANVILKSAFIVKEFAQ